MCSSTTWLVFVNFMFLVISLVVLIVGTIIQTSLDSNYSLFSQTINAPSALTISFGALLCLTAMLAILSVYCENLVLLCAYNFVVSVLIVIEIALGVTYMIAKSYLLELITNSLRSAESKFTTDQFTSSTWNSLQRDLKCCGVDNYKEWFHYLGNSSLPDSCCLFFMANCGRNAITDGNYFQTGCSNAIVQWVHRHASSIAILLSCIIILQIVSLFLSRRFRRAMRRSDSIDSYETLPPHI